MKKLFLLIFTLALINKINSQELVYENKYVLGGSFYFLNQKNGPPIFIDDLSFSNLDSKNSSFGFSPYFGKVVSPNVIVGMQLTILYSKSKSLRRIINNPNFSSEIENKRNTIGFQLFTRYTLKPENQFNIYFQPYAGYNSISNKSFEDGNPSNTNNGNYFNVGIGSGMIYNLSKKFRIIFGLGGISYINGKDDRLGSQRYSSLSTSLILSSASIGLELKL